MPKSRPPYPPTFRRQMVELVRTGRTPEELAREFEPTAQAIRHWAEGVGQSPREHLAAVPVHDCDQVEEPSGHREGAEVGCPYLIGALHGEVPEQIRIDVSTLARSARAGPRIQRLEPHQAH